ncbi:hypothetical protein ACLQVS_001731 [Campylobacter jejuni]
MVYFIAVRDDGTGSRLISLLNTFYLCDKITSSDKNVRFFWNDKIVLYKTAVSADPGNNFKNIGDQKVIGSSIEPKEEIFDKSFIEQFFIENKYNYNTNWLFENRSYPKDIFEISSWNGQITIEKIKELFNQKKYNYFFVHHNDLARELNLDYEDYRSKTSYYWNKIVFTKRFQNIIHLVEKKIRQMKEDYHVIHLRSGDSIYSYCNLRKFNLQSIFHATCYEIAIGIVQKILKSEKVVIVGDDIDSISQLVNFLNKENIVSIENFRDSQQFSTLELFIFDVVFMSKAKSIYGTFSAVARLSEMINNDVKLYNYYNIFNDEIKYEILKSNLFKLDLHPDQKAFSLFHVYLLARKNNEKLSVLLDYLNKALEYDCENDKYRLHIIDCLLQFKELNKAEDTLSDYLKNREKEILETFFLHGWDGIVFYSMFDAYFFKENYKYPNIFFMSRQILKNGFGAEYHIKQHLSWKIGEALVCCQTAKSYMLLPFNLTKIILQWKKNRKEINSKLLLSEYKDYYKVDKIKNYFTYQLGSLVVCLFKNWYKGEIFKFPFKIYFLLKKNKKRG